MANLFVGRLSKSTRQRDIEDIFSAYGRLSRCDVKYGTGMAYAFVDFQYRKDAEDAMKYENDREIDGQRIVVEFSRGPKKSFQSDDQCYSCGRRGHFARDCRDGGRGNGGGGGGGRRSGGSSRDRGSRRYSRSRSRSKSRERRRSHSRDRKRSRSTDRSKSRSRTPDKKSASKSPRGESRSKSRERSTSKERQEGNSSPAPAKESSPAPEPSQQSSEGGQNGQEESTS